MYWKLNHDEYQTAEYVFYETKGSIYVDAMGNLHQTVKGLWERVDSTTYETFDDFVDEIENAKIRVERELMSQ